MCGIAGILSQRGHSLSERETENLQKVTQSLFHRGPDAQGNLRTRSNIFLGAMRRLSINDLLGGQQPLSDESGDIQLIYNGEIYNSPHLRKELETKGYRFKTHSDGEVICHLYHDYRENLFEKLDGMYAAALWIESEQKLILARDIPGEKPLYFSKTQQGNLVFASEIKAIVQHPDVSRELNLQALWDFPTFLWIPEPETVYLHIHALPRGHLWILTPNEEKLKPIANHFEQGPIISDSKIAVCETKRIVTEAVHSRLLSDVPVGSFLSGGLDSSIVATLASRELRHLDTFTIGFENVADPYHGRADESADAALTAKWLGTRHHEIRVTSTDFREALEKFAYFGDQPFSVSSGLGIYFIAKCARENGIKVLLSGDGADECFGGYSWYSQFSKLFEMRMQSNIQDPLSHPVSFQDFGMSIEERIQAMSRLPAPTLGWSWHYYATETQKQRFYNPDRFHGIQSSLRFFNSLSREAGPLDFIRHDRGFYFPFEMMRKADRMMMAHSVEGRLPFAAPSVLNLASRLEWQSMVRGPTLKWVLREAFRDILPMEIIERPKHGFNVPIDHWLQGDWKPLLRDTFSPNSQLCKMGLTHPDAERFALEALADPMRLNGHTLFSFIMLEIWLKGLVK